jgi:hypothetical protein
MKFQFTNQGPCLVIIRYIKRGKDYSNEDQPYTEKEVDLDEAVLLHSVQEIVSIVPENPTDDEDDGPDDYDYDDDDLDDESGDDLDDDNEPDDEFEDNNSDDY